MSENGSRPRVVLTNWVHPEVIAFLEQDFEVVANPGTESLAPEQVLERARTAQALMVFMPDRVDDAFLAQCPHLKIIAGALKGRDNFDVKACTRRGIWFTVVPDLLSGPTAELALALLLGVTRRVREGDQRIRSGQYRGWRPVLYGIGLAGKTVGIMGMGGVGKALAQRLLGFEVKVVYSDVKPLSPEEERELHVQRLEPDALVAQSDVLIPLLHLTPETHHYFDGRRLAQLKRGAVLVNVGRGSLVDEAAVARALASGQLAAYAADVFEMEDWARTDRPAGVEPALLQDASRTLFTPHLGSAVDDVRREIALSAARSIRQALHGEKPFGAVNEIQR